MSQKQKTAEGRLYQWLKRKTTPIHAWKSMTMTQLGAKIRCSKSQICRVLPQVVAKLDGISLQEAAKLVDDVMEVRRGRLLDFEVELIRQIRQLKKPASVEWIAHHFCVSEKQVRDVCQRLGVDGAGGYSYWTQELIELLPERFNHPQLNENIRIRKQLREKHRKISNDLRFKKMFGRILESSDDPHSRRRSV